jgi:hypothetical protein
LLRICFPGGPSLALRRKGWGCSAFFLPLQNVTFRDISSVLMRPRPRIYSIQPMLAAPSNCSTDSAEHSRPTHLHLLGAAKKSAKFLREAIHGTASSTSHHQFRPRQ